MSARTMLPAPAAKRLRKIQADARITDFQGWCKARGLPIPTPEHRFAPPRRWRFDWCWPDHNVVLEVEGGVWTQGRHSRGSGFLRDIEKYNDATLRGWRVFRCTPQTLKSRETLLLLTEALKRDPVHP